MKRAEKNLMKCPKCEKTVPSRANACRHCGSKFARKSDALVRGQTLSPGLSMVCGGALAFIGVVLLIYNVWVMGAIALGLGATLAFVGVKSQ